MDKKLTKEQKITQLTQSLQKAKDAALALKDIPDDGTCNLDHAKIYLKGWRYDSLKAICGKLGLRVSKWNSSEYHIYGYQVGQAERRSQMAEAFVDSLCEDGYEAFVYYAID